MKMIFLSTSSNKKTGDIMQSYSSRSTCPKSCVFNKLRKNPARDSILFHCLC